MIKKRNIIFYKDYFTEFYKVLPNKVKLKIDYILYLITYIETIPTKFLKSLNQDGLFEIRIEFESNIFRVFCCFDEGKLVVIFNGFQKKSQKLPKNVLKKAIKIKNDYFSNKEK